MKTYLAMLIAVFTTASVQAAEIKVAEPGEGKPVTLTGKLGFYNEPGEDGFTITITTNDVAFLNSVNRPGLPHSMPMKNVAIFNAEKNKELKEQALAGKTVTIHGTVEIWERHIKLGRKDILIIQLR